MARWSYSLFANYTHLIDIMQTCLKALNLQNTCQSYSVECVSMIKSILAIIFHVTYGAVSFQLTYFNDCEYMCSPSSSSSSSSNRKYESLAIVLGYRAGHYSKRYMSCYVRILWLSEWISKLISMLVNQPVSQWVSQSIVWVNLSVCKHCTSMTQLQFNATAAFQWHSFNDTAAKV